MTGANFYTYFLEIFKRTDKSTEFYETLTDVVMDMKLRFNSEDFKTVSSALTITSIGDYSTALPSNFGHLIGDPIMRETSGDEVYPSLSKISIERYNELYGDRYNTATGNKNTGVPKHYCIFGGNLLVGPPVDKTTYTFRVTHTTEAETAMVSGTTDVPFTDRYRKTVRYGCLKEMYLMLENYQEAEVWSNLFEIDMKRIIDNDMDNVKDDMPMSYNGV